MYGLVCIGVCIYIWLGMYRSVYIYGLVCIGVCIYVWLGMYRSVYICMAWYV